MPKYITHSCLDNDVTNDYEGPKHGTAVSSVHLTNSLVPLNSQAALLLHMAITSNAELFHACHAARYME